MTEIPWEYAPAPESAGAAQLAARYRPFVAGEFRGGRGPARPDRNPATEAALAEVATAAPAEAAEAVEAARTALAEWAEVPGARRAKHLFRLARLLQERARELAVLETLDTGRPVAHTREGDLPSAAAWLFHYAGWADKLEFAGFGERPRPLGVVAQLLSADAPLLSLVRAAAPALACGNTVVVKPSPHTPLSALVFAEVCRQAGLPAGVVNVLPGDAELGAALAGSAVDQLFLSGSASAAAAVRSAAGAVPLRVDATAPAAHVIFDDAALDQAVDGVLRGCGQSGLIGSRVFVQEPLAERFTEHLRARLDAVRVADPLDRNTEVGPLVTERRRERFAALVDEAAAAGALVHAAAAELPERGWFVRPAVCTGVDGTLPVAREAPGGPVLAVRTFRTPEEAVAGAGDAACGAAGVWTEKGSRALWAAERMRAEVTWANTTHRYDPAAAAGSTGGRSGLETYLDV
ncbi:aldehyde dehydrogenase family protein [Salinifilum ghardaiensis]